MKNTSYARSAMMVAIALLAVNGALAADSDSAKPNWNAGSDAPIGAGIQIFDIGKLDRSPVVKVQTAPQYPAAMRRAEIEGEVLVDFVVNTDGNVVNATVARSSHREFESAAIAAVTKWKFRPGMKSGRVVNTHMQVPIAFALDEK